VALVTSDWLTTVVKTVPSLSWKVSKVLKQMDEYIGGNGQFRIMSCPEYAGCSHTVHHSRGEADKYSNADKLHQMQHARYQPHNLIHLHVDQHVRGS